MKDDGGKTEKRLREGNFYRNNFLGILRKTFLLYLGLLYVHLVSTDILFCLQVIYWLGVVYSVRTILNCT
jgi:hypothetical protein